MAGSRILVIDDDEGIRVTIEAALSDCEVQTVDSALAALPLLAGQDFDAVLCDLVMPCMTGAELYESLAADSHYRQRFIFVSGGSLPLSLRSFVDQMPVPMLKKPFSVTSLRESVALLLDEGLDSLPARE